MYWCFQFLYHSLKVFFADKSKFASRLYLNCNNFDSYSPHYSIFHSHSQDDFFRNLFLLYFFKLSSGHGYCWMKQGVIPF